MSQNRNVMARVEDFLSGSVEGVFNRLFRSGIQKGEIARRLERAMDENIVAVNGQRRAPNVYATYLSEADFQRFKSYLSLLQSQLQEGLYQVAQQRGYFMPRRPTVTVNADGQLGKGDVRVDTSTVDAAVPNGAPVNPALAGVAPDFTQVIAGGMAPSGQGSAQPGASPAGSIPDAALVLRTRQGPGQTYPLNREVIHIGRKRTNDIVINEEKISRFHAEIRYEGGQFVLYDLGSLNGVVINNSLVRRQATLQPGDVIVIGSYSFVFERR